MVKNMFSDSRVLLRGIVPAYYQVHPFKAPKNAPKYLSPKGTFAPRHACKKFVPVSSRRPKTASMPEPPFHETLGPKSVSKNKLCDKPIW